MRYGCPYRIIKFDEQSLNLVWRCIASTDLQWEDSIVVDKHQDRNPRSSEVAWINNDYLDNSIGDVLSGVISNILIIFFWYNYGKLPYFYLLGVFPIFINLLSFSSKLYENYINY